MAFYQAMPWHEGERRMHALMNVPEYDNPTVTSLSPQLARHLQVAPLVAIGTLDKEGRPWTTLWGGEPGFAQPLGGPVVGFRLPVTRKYDPVVEEIVGGEATGEVVREPNGKGRLVSGLTIDLQTRKRVKMAGRMIASVLTEREDEVTSRNETVAEVQLVVKVEQSLGNCPKYLNSKQITPRFSHPKLAYDGPHLSPEAIKLIGQADLFFMSTAGPQDDMDTNHRGGPPGFMRVLSAGSHTEPASVVYPEYSGNRLYQSLGNMMLNPMCGICVPNFETGDMLYFTGSTEIFAGKEAHAVLPKSNLCVKVTITSARLVTDALPFRGIEGERSPYNPVVRYLPAERPPAHVDGQDLQQATLTSKTNLTPTISRFRFSLQNATNHKAGQYVTLDFSKLLDFGYSHMRDDDPRSLNDDFIRTFTVSSPPGDPPNPVKRLEDDEFEITVRKVGTVTGFLFKRADEIERTGETLEVGVKGFGGEFMVEQSEGETVYFIAAGVGITPLLPALGSALDFKRLKTLWSVRSQDLGIVLDSIAQHGDFAESLVLFVTGGQDCSPASIEQLSEAGVDVRQRRMQVEDVVHPGVKRYYICTSTPMRKQLIEWLPEKELIFEDFNF